MPQTANVQSIEALKAFRISLCKFAEAARNSLGEADADLQRHASWLSEDRMRHWRAELVRRTEKARQAKMALLEKRLRTNAAGGRQSCIDEEKALARAMAQLEEAERKAANTKRWIRQLDEEIFKYKGLIQSLNHALDVDFVKILAMLDGMLDALDRYVSENLPRPEPRGLPPRMPPPGKTEQSSSEDANDDSEAGQPPPASQPDNPPESAS